MRTHWGGGADRDTPDLLPDYEPSVGATVKALRSDWCQETGDFFKMAQAVLGLVANSSLPIHLRLGNDAVEYAGEAEAARAPPTPNAGDRSASRPRFTPGSLIRFALLGSAGAVRKLSTTGRRLERSPPLS
jgi:hypothetical protein